MQHSNSWTMPQVLAIGAVVAVSAVATGAAVSTATTNLYAPATVQPTVARPVAAFPVNQRVVEVRRAAQAPIFAQQNAGVEEVQMTLNQAPQGLSLVQLMMIPASALVAGFAAFLWKSKSEQKAWAMASADAEGDAEEAPTALVGKDYKSGSRADSYYGSQGSGKMADPMANTYEAPKGGYTAASGKDYTPTTDPSKSFYGSQGSKTSMPAYTPPKGAYSATNNKSYKPTTVKADSYFGNKESTVPVLGAKWYGPDRPKWLGPLTTDKSVPSYLTGEFAGDYGWDSLGLAADPDNFARYREAEIQHGRWAMLGAMGCLLPEIGAKYGYYDSPEPVWFKAGAYIFDHCGLAADTTTGGQMQSIFGHANSGNVIPLSPVFIFLCQIVFMGLGEGFRASRITGRDGTYPGKFFDPMGMADDPDAFNDLKVKEVKNGRLAMLAMLGFYCQAFVTQQGPVQNWADHIADPWANNFFSQNLGNM